MTAYPLDIIIPIWNRPVEVRAALASFVAGSPMARLVMVNIGSERETEAILDEFAEALDDRALLLATERNIGTVAALNAGLSRSTAPFVLVATPFTRLNEGWFEAVSALFAQHPDVGAVVLKSAVKTANVDCLEADHGSFAAMILRRALYDAAGGFDENMDGGEWALRDYARRSLDCGYRTFLLRCGQLTVQDCRELGSLVRREERVRLARQTYAGRWGEPQSFLLFCSDTLFGVDPDTLKTAILAAARRGDSLVVVSGHKVAKQLTAAGFSALHENVSYQPLPRFFAIAAFAKIVAKIAATEPATILISAEDSPGVELKSCSFPEFVTRLHERSNSYYTRSMS